MSYIEEYKLINEETGEIEVDSKRERPSNPEGFVLVYRNALEQLATEAPNFSVVKVFMILSSMQEYTDGINVTKQAIADKIGATYKTVWNAFKWLEEKDYVRTRKFNGQTQFILNPKITTCGRKRQEKNSLWINAKYGI